MSVPIGRIALVSKRMPAPSSSRPTDLNEVRLRTLTSALREWLRLSVRRAFDPEVWGLAHEPDMVPELLAVLAELAGRLRPVLEADIAPGDALREYRTAKALLATVGRECEAQVRSMEVHTRQQAARSWAFRRYGWELLDLLREVDRSPSRLRGI